MLKGVAASAGVAIAQAMLWQPPIEYDFIPQKAGDVTKDIARFNGALARVTAKNDLWQAEAARKLRPEEAVLFKAYGMILTDEEGVLLPIKALIEEKGYSAERAVTSHFNAVAKQLQSLESEYMRQRAEDIFGLRDQLMTVMLDLVPEDMSHLNKPTIVVAQNFSPAAIAELDRSRFAGFVCEGGTYSGHIAIIARTLGIPAVVGLAGITQMVREGALIALDGKTGEVWLQPSEAEIGMLRARNDAYNNSKSAVQRFRGVATVTKDGRRIELQANVGQVEEVDAALLADAEAIGLYRTELLHLNRTRLPTEEEQFERYKTALHKMNGKAITFRTLDEGEHKSLLVAPERQGNNPSLGYRGIRMSLGRPALFRTQLRALLRASAYGSVKIMFPMVSCQHELEQALAALQSVKDELAREGVPFDEKLPAGVMIETPAAAVVAQHLAQQVDFITLGLNDLIQFTAAADRTNPQLAHLYAVYHPAVLQFIHTAVQAAHHHHISCILCGDIPEMEHALPLLLGLGADGFSLSPHAVLPARALLNDCSYTSCKELAHAALHLQSFEQIKNLLHNFRL